MNALNDQKLPAGQSVSHIIKQWKALECELIIYKFFKQTELTEFIYNHFSENLHCVSGDNIRESSVVVILKLKFYNYII